MRKSYVGKDSRSRGVTLFRAFVAASRLELESPVYEAGGLPLPHTALSCVVVPRRFELLPPVFQADALPIKLQNHMPRHGAHGQIRTDYLLFTRQALFQVSYTGLV